MHSQFYMLFSHFFVFILNMFVLLSPLELQNIILYCRSLEVLILELYIRKISYNYICHELRGYQ